MKRQDIKRLGRLYFFLFYGPYHTPLALPAVRDLTRDGRWSTYDVSVFKLSNVTFWGKCARMENNLKLPSPTKRARLGPFPPASQAGRLAGPVFYVCVFSLVLTQQARKTVHRNPNSRNNRLLILQFLIYLINISYVEKHPRTRKLGASIAVCNSR